MKRTIYCLATCCVSFLAQAAPTEVIFWDFLSGGDGVRMTQIVEEFNKSQQDIRVTKSTLTWGEPFYTKIHTAVVAGQTPDVMTYHLSHFPAGMLAKDLRPLTTEELAQAGLKASDFQKSLVDSSLEMSKKYGQSDQLFGVPLDIHTLVLYYNKTALQKADLLDTDGKPKGLEGIDAFKATLTAFKEKARLTPIVFSSTSADAARPGGPGTHSSSSRKAISSKVVSYPLRAWQTRATNPFRYSRTSLSKDCLRRTLPILRW
jgi:multiple sugar transport system substrate-binding protein